MTAEPTTSDTGNESSVAPTTAQTGFNARDRLAGRLDDTTVRQAAEGADLRRSTPRVNGSNHPVQNTKTADNAEVGR